MSDAPPSALDRIRRRAQAPPPPVSECPNCGTAVDDHFCPRCGQKNATRLVSLRQILRDAVDDQLSLNSALPRTLGALFFRPGRLTADYTAGRIARYIPPFRVFLLSSLVFFLALSFVASPDVVWRRVERGMGADTTVRRSGGVVRGDTIFYVDSGGVARRAPIVSMDVDTAAVPGWLGPLARRLKRQEAKINAMSAREGVQRMLVGMEETAAKAVFLLMPIFALLLKLLYLRKKRLYVEHFVFSLHLHSLAFLLFTVALLAGRGWAWLAAVAWVGVVALVGLKRVYGQGWAMTTLKFAALGVAYVTVLGFVMLGVMLVTVLTV